MEIAIIPKYKKYGFASIRGVKNNRNLNEKQDPGG